MITRSSNACIRRFARKKKTRTPVTRGSYVPCVATWKTVQKIAAALTDMEEGTSYGTPSFKVRGGKFMLRMRNDDEVATNTLVLRTSEKEALLADERGIFFSTPHYDGHPTILVRLPKIGEKELRELLIDAWRLTAPPRARKAHPEI